MLAEIQYFNLVRNTLRGNFVNSRNGNIYSTFGNTLKIDLQREFPLITTKKMFVRGIIEELLFFMRGETDTTILSEKNVHIWKKNTSCQFIGSIGLDAMNYPENEMGKMYGFNWRNYGGDQENEGFDQLQYVIENLKNNPNCRRHLITTFDPSRNLDPDNFESVLTPCHGLTTQFYVRNKLGKKYLDCATYQRSADIALGLPFNIASYATFLEIMAKITHLDPGTLTIHLGNCHIYEEHADNLKMQLGREIYNPPTIKINENWEYQDISSINELRFSDFDILGYKCHPKIDFTMKE